MTDIAALTQPSITPVTLVGGPVPQVLAPANPKRFAVGFSMIGPDSTLISPFPNDDTTGFQMVVVTGVLWFTVRDHGAFAQVAWYAWNSPGASIVSVWELVLNRE